MLVKTSTADWQSVRGLRFFFTKGHDLSCLL